MTTIEPTNTDKAKYIVERTGGCWQKENIATLVATVVLVLGLFWMSNSWHSLWGLLLLLNMNYRKDKGKTND
jgi:hypothetical protein